MKHFLLVLIFLLPFATSAQPALPLDKKTGQVIFTGDVDAKGVSQPELYLRIKAFLNTYTSGENSIKLLRDDASLISGNTFTDVIINDGTTTERQRLWYTLVVELEEGRFSYELKDFSLQRHCIPAREVPCEEQTKLVSLEKMLAPTGKKSAKGRPSIPSSPERVVNKTVSSLIAALRTSALTEQHIAGIKP
jgi:hypothetical protein